MAIEKFFVDSIEKKLAIFADIFITLALDIGLFRIITTSDNMNIIIFQCCEYPIFNNYIEIIEGYIILF